MTLREIFFIFFTTWKNGEATDNEIRWFRSAIHTWMKQCWNLFIKAD